MKLTKPQRTLLEWLAGTQHGGGFLAGSMARMARTLARRGFVEESGGRWFQITQAGRDAVKG